MSWLESTLARRAVEILPVVVAAARSRWGRLRRLEDELAALRFEVEQLRGEVARAKVVVRCPGCPACRGPE